MKQLSIFDYLEHEAKNENDFITYFVDWLKAYCKYWNKDWMERIKEQPMIETIYNTICRFTKTHFFNFEGIYFDKDLDKAHDTEKLVRFIKGDKKDENRFM